ncbi:Uncharacterized protein BM_BM8118 [Brugia malayi]|uniref:Uncharacterized protein n=1 Tax=Brugia malayi TaxID=6279 RepID=A0A4E9F8F6_BRUMA|nr:Uncharacterized protein BM_BM8118 [Brugia malayi]VIO93096.1 Uncharacterized protein BM_BM8118 [Brugia malayi]
MDQFRNEVEMRSFEETKYLRRMSQNKHKYPSHFSSDY